ncbi:MAG: hypothetical protein JWM99_3385, partial [Verrucomicrobiales bacterium]|nr:hypothetical protein [Verrucomicrobiales bacterium]
IWVESEGIEGRGSTFIFQIPDALILKENTNDSQTNSFGIDEAKPNSIGTAVPGNAPRVEQVNFFAKLEHTE